MARGNEATASTTSPNPLDTSAARSVPPNSVMSAPAEKMRSAPVMTTAPGRSAASSSMARRSSASSPIEREFTGGRSSRNTATLPTRSLVTAVLMSGRT